MSIKSVAHRWTTWAPQILAIFRVIAALVFFLAGSVKLFAFPIGVPPGGGTVEIFTEAWFAGLIETIGGALLAIGLFTRPVAFIASGEMAVAYFQYHAPHSIWPVVNQGMPAMLYCFFWLYCSAAGAEVWSIDALRRKRAERNLEARLQ